MKKILIIGAGHVVGYHLGAIRRMWPLAEVSVTDINSSKASNPDLTKFHARFVPDSGRRAEMQGADLVVICVPCEEHFVVAKEALEDGKIVLLEKPPTKTVAEFEELVTLSKSVPGAKLICAFHAAHDLTINQFTAEMQDGVHPKYGKLVGIRAEFSDPYVENGLVIKSMGGSWEDSSSNALSVVARFVDLSQFDLKSALITNDVPATDGCKCLDSKSRVMYEFSSGKAEIFTDWTTGRNRKVAELTLQDDAGKETKFLLHHSKQKILIESGGGDEEEYLIYADCDNGQTRLDNHYDGVYGDLQLMIANQTDNTDLGLQITKLWIGAYEMANIKG